MHQNEHVSNKGHFAKHTLRHVVGLATTSPLVHAPMARLLFQLNICIMIRGRNHHIPVFFCCQLVSLHGELLAEIRAKVESSFVCRRSTYTTRGAARGKSQSARPGHTRAPVTQVALRAGADTRKIRMRKMTGGRRINKPNASFRCATDLAVVASNPTNQLPTLISEQNIAKTAWNNAFGSTNCLLRTVLAWSRLIRQRRQDTMV